MDKGNQISTRKRWYDFEPTDQRGGVTTISINGGPVEVERKNGLGLTRNESLSSTRVI